MLRENGYEWKIHKIAELIKLRIYNVSQFANLLVPFYLFIIRMESHV